MDDGILTRKAIEEIVREMREQSKGTLDDSKEVKRNPLIRPNKRFLDRTINSMIAHNDRSHRQTQNKCTRKLRELDHKVKKRHHKKHKRRHKRRLRSRSESSHEIFSSSSDERPKHRKERKHKKCHSRERSRSRQHSEAKRYTATKRKRSRRRGSELEIFDGNKEAMHLSTVNMLNAATYSHIVQYQALVTGLGFMQSTNSSSQANNTMKNIESISALSSTSSPSSTIENECIATISVTSTEGTHSMETATDMSSFSHVVETISISSDSSQETDNKDDAAEVVLLSSCENETDSES